MKLRTTVFWLALASAGVPALVTPVVAQPQQSEDDSAALVREGREALRARSYAAAAQALDQALALNPRRIDAYILRAAVHAAQKQYVAGVAVMRKAATLAPNDIDVQAALGTQLLLAGQVSEGVTLLEKVVAADGKRYDALLLLGHHYYQNGRWREAIVAYQSYLATRPATLASEDPVHRVDLADALLRARQPAKAIELFAASVGVPRVDLRARLGVAWATAALDCRRARPMLAALNSEAKQYPDIGLVDGQCALATGDIDGAMKRAREYIAAQPRQAAAGHALLGEALAARGDLAAAKQELQTAQSLEPSRRRWTVRLATVLRKSKQAAQAVELLEKLGPPQVAATDAEWWIELGEAKLVVGNAADVVTRLAAVRDAIPDDARLLTVLALAYLRQGNMAQGTETLEAAMKIDRTLVRTRRLLAAALTDRGATEIEKGEFSAAVATLQHGREIASSPALLRNLAIALLELGQANEARELLGAINKPEAIDLLLLARANSNKLAFQTARDFYQRSASAAQGELVVTVAIDAASAELEFGDPANAVTWLEKIDAAQAAAPEFVAALRTAKSAAGIAAIRAGNGAKAIELLRDGAAADAPLERKCELALAHVVAGERDAALKLLRAVAGKSCPFPAPADTQAAPILEAYLDGLTPSRAAKALDRLNRLAARSTGAAAALLATATRVVALSAAADAFRNGRVPQAKAYLAQATRVNTRVGNDELAVNAAVVDIAEGRIDAGVAALEKLSSKVPEALITLGIGYERSNEASKALDAWRRARKSGVRFAPLNDWIDAKERVFGTTTGGAP